MPTLDNSRLSIDPDRLHNRLTIIVRCDVNFSDPEVEAINLLGLHYVLRCQVANVDRWDKRPVANFDDWTFPTDLEVRVSNHEHVMLTTDRPMADVHTPFMAGDTLQAELILLNTDTGEAVAETQTSLVSVDLAA